MKNIDEKIWTVHVQVILIIFERGYDTRIAWGQLLSLALLHLSWTISSMAQLLQRGSSFQGLMRKETKLAEFWDSRTSAMILASFSVFCIARTSKGSSCENLRENGHWTDYTYIYISIYIDLYTHRASLHIYVYLNASRDCRSLGWGLHTETWLSLSQHSLQDLQRRQTNPKIPSIPNWDPGFLDRQMGTGLHQLWKYWSSPWQNLLELCWPGCFCQSLSPISIHSLI